MIKRFTYAAGSRSQLQRSSPPRQWWRREIGISSPRGWQKLIGWVLYEGSRWAEAKGGM